MDKLILKGLTEVQGMKFNHIEGGFGESKKAMLVKDIAEIHDREQYKVNELINNNKKRFKYGVDIIDLKQNEFAILLKDNGIYSQNSINASKNIYLLSERGYSKLLKILEDDFAWEQYEKLVDGYFSMREQQITKKLPAMDLLKLQYEVLGDHDERLSYLENNMTIDYGQQQQLQNTAKSKVIKALGGIHSNAYKERSVRSKVFSAIWKDYKDYFMLGSYKDTARVNYDKALDFFNDWAAPGRILREIEDCNKQMSL